MSVPVLQLTDVDAFYGGAQILHGVSLEVTEGEVLGLVGRNGAGKTTTLLAIYGIPAVRRGSIAVDGQRLGLKHHHEAAELGVAIVPQGRRILPNLTIEENLTLGAAAQRSGPWDLDAVYELFPILRDRRASSGMALSGGQQQMLAIGRALMLNPRCLLLDEPTEGLAPVLVHEVVEALTRLRGSGTSLLLVAPRVDLVRKLADRYAVMVKGEIVESGEIEGLTDEVAQRHIAVG